MPWQITKIIDNFGVEKIEIKYFKVHKKRGYDFHNYQVIYAKIKDWRDLISELKKAK